MTKKTQANTKQFRLTEKQKLAWLRLYRSQNVGPATFRDLISFFGSASGAIEALPELAARGGAAARIRVCSAGDAEREMDSIKSFGATLVALGEPEYPVTLRAVEQSPPILCMKFKS